MNKKTLLLLVSIILIGALSVAGTVAYFTDTDADTNTFTVGSVSIKLDEAKVNEDGSYVKDHDNRVQENNYHLIPGHTYIKDPTVTVLGGSSKAYVRMLVTVNYSGELDAIFAPSGVDLISIFNEYSAENWPLYAMTENEAANTRTYEFRYKEVVAEADTDTALDDLFESITIPGEITKEQLATLVTRNENGKITSQFTISVEAHAIQADGFDTADDAWTAFEEQK